MSGAERNVVLITGASGQVGSVLTQRFSKSAPLALFDAATPAPKGIDPGSKLLSIGGVDLIDEGQVQAAVARVRAELGTIRAVVHTVGGYADGFEVKDQPLEQVRKMFELNVVTAVNVIKAALPDVLASEHGRIVVFGSRDALHARAGASAYAASKAALLRFAEGLAEEVVPRGVCVRVILPNTIDTPRNRASMPGADFKSWVTLDEVANAVEFALDPRSSGQRFAQISLGA